MADEQTTAPPVEGVTGTTPASQTTVPEAQAPAQPLETGQPKVDGVEQPASSPQEEPRQPSDFYKSRERSRRRIESLEDTIDSMQKQMATLTQPPPPVPQPFDNTRFMENPEETLMQREVRLKEEIRKEIIEQELPRIQNEQNQERRKQEALELIFPKESFDSRVTLKDRANKNPEKLEAIQEILEAEGLNEMSIKNPVQAANIAIELYNGRNKKTVERVQNPAAIDKKLMGNQTAVPQNTGGAIKVPTLTEVRAERESLEKEVEANPSLRQDPAWLERREKSKQNFVQLARELEKKESGKI